MQDPRAQEILESKSLDPHSAKVAEFRSLSFHSEISSVSVGCEIWIPELPAVALWILRPNTDVDTRLNLSRV